MTTIYAVSSGRPPAAIAVVRISGPAACTAAETLAGRLPAPRHASLRGLRDADGALLDYDYEEVRATQTILAHARKTFLVADHTKFTRRPMVQVGRLDQVDTFFTDRMPPPEIVAMIERQGVTLAVADSADEP